MVPQVTVPRGLETLPARPPTPPREKTLDTKQKQLLARHSLDPRRSLQTPPNYSPDSSDLSDPTSRRTRKKVGFSSQAEYCEPPTQVEHIAKQPTPVSVSSTASLSKPIKSILKPSPPAITNPLDPSAGSDEATRHANLATMLESTTKQLAGTDRESKLDAYMVLVRALKTSNNLPDRIALQDKMSLFMQFIQRDVTTKTATGSIDSSLSNHASTLLITFLNFPAIASTLSNEFGVFIIDHCIRSFEDASVPKDVARHLMQIVASQTFSAKVMTADRVGRLATSLHRIEEHLKGKSIIMSRILIYRRLIRQSKAHMVTHSDWVLDLFTDMLSSIKEIRATAIALGLEASFSISKEKHFSRKVMEILQLTVDDTKYIEYYVDRLKAMAKDKQDSAAVPQIWSVVILIMRCPVDRWEFFGPWLEIIQLCFNSSDYHTKLEANYAWNRLVYSLQLNEQSFSKTIATVCQPFLSQLKRKVVGKQNEELRKVVLGSVCNLYYYAFKPNASLSHVDSFWDACVPQLIKKMTTSELDARASERSPTKVQDHTQQAILILTGLFDSSTLRLWKEDHIADSPLVKPDELPALDPKWVRRNSTKVFTVVEPILSKTFLDLSNSGSASARLWRTLVGAVASAASKEVKVSTDTAAFMANAFTFLFQMWSRGTQDLEGGNDVSRLFFEATHAFLSTLIGSLGLLPFTEKQLCMGKQNTFMPVATPSHRPGKGQGLTRTPFHHLFSILATLPPGTTDDDDLADLIRSVTTPFLASKSSRTKVDLGHELMQSLPMDILIPYGPWVVISEVICNSLEQSQASHSSTHSGSEPPIGHEYREVVKHLERGIRSTPNLPWEHWQSLFQTLITRATDETGEAGCAIAVIEPLAKIILEMASNDHQSQISLTLFRSGIELLSSAKQPRDRQAVDAARRRLWGTSIAGSRSVSFDPYDNLYRLSNLLLDTSYQHYDESEADKIAVPLLTEAAGFLARCNQVLVFKSLINLQGTIGVWIQDANGQYNSRQSSNVSEAVKLLWNRICNILAEAENMEKVQLDTIEPLLCSAFESKHRHIVNTVSTMWNRAFEQADEVRYPERLKSVLLSLRPYVDIILPGLDISSHESSGHQPIFIDSQEDDLDVMNPPAKKSENSTPQPEMPSSSRRSNTPVSVKLSLSAQRRSETTPDISRPKSSRRSAKARLRHDDSQIQFAVIDSSSPSRNVAESQVLTDRQKEVRERQQENAALFPEIRSSAEKSKLKQQSSKKSQSSSASKPERTTTPKSHRSFEDYVSSTPTPRRGQAPLIEDHDHEMTDEIDIPSSPPEPRRYPLVPEITKSQSSSSSVLDEWQFLSSPVSGTPLQHRQLVSNEHATTSRQVDMTIHDAVMPEPAAAAADEEAPLDDDVEHANAEDEARDHLMDEVDGVLPPVAQEPKGPATPPNARSLKVQGTPRSDPDLYVDALTSPAPHTPRPRRSLARSAQPVVKDSAKVSQSKDHSFEASDIDERSMLRLMADMDARESELLPTHAADSPAKPDDAAGSPVLDCITVNTGSHNTRLRSKKNKAVQSSSPTRPEAPADIAGSPPSSKKSKKKRKRTAEMPQESSVKKLRYSKDGNVEINAEPDSQLLPSNNNFLREHSESSGEEQPSSSSQGYSSPERNSVEHASPGNLSAVGSPINESEAVNLQIAQEASQSSREDVGLVEAFAEDPKNQSMDVELSLELSKVNDVDMEGRMEEEQQRGAGLIGQPQKPEEKEEEVEAAPVPEKSSIEKIMDALRGGLDELRTAKLSREEVYQVEDLLMDMKRELYGAEARGRG